MYSVILNSKDEAVCVIRDYDVYVRAFGDVPPFHAYAEGEWGNVLLVIRKSDMKMVGCMQVHNVLTERMKKYTGHVGYSVRPSERRKGYAKKMLAKALDFLSTFG